MQKKIVITYGSFDLFHIGHLNLLKKLKALGDFLIVGVSTDSFNEKKGKQSVIGYEQRACIVAELKCVDLVIPEFDWGQKIDDIKQYKVSVFGMGDDWRGEFDFLESHCQVVYLPRTPGVSSSKIKNYLGKPEKKDAVSRTNFHGGPLV